MPSTSDRLSASNTTITRENVSIINKRGKNSFPLSGTHQHHMTLMHLMSLQDLTPSQESSVTTIIDQDRIPNPSFYPINTRSPSMDMFQTLVEKELTTLDTMSSTLSSSNLTTRERSALKALTENTHITIRPADKGGTVVILD